MMINYLIYELNKFRSSKAVLDRQCSGHSSCVVRASATMFPSDECPDVGKYLEVHYRCVQDTSSHRRELIPPWLEDLHATFRPPAKTVTVSTTTVKISDNNDNGDSSTNDDEVASTAAISEAPQSSSNITKSPPNSQGRYFLIHDNTKESDNNKNDDDSGVTNLIISVSISVVSSILSVIIIVHICKRVRSKNVTSTGSGSSSSQSCYECQSPTLSGGAGEYQIDPNKVTNVPVIPIQESLFAFPSLTIQTK